MTEMKRDSLPAVRCTLEGVDGNAYSLMGYWAAAARRAKWPQSEISRVLTEARAGDYDHLVVVLMDNCAPPLEEEEPDDEFLDDEGDDEEYP